MDKKLGVQDLEIYQQAYKLALTTHKLTLKFPKLEQYAGIADQLRRSSKSIVANIVEGFAKQKFYKEEFKRMLVYSIGSADETILWIQMAFDLDYIQDKDYEALSKEYKILVKRISYFTSRISY